MTLSQAKWLAGFVGHKPEEDHHGLYWVVNEGNGIEWNCPDEDLHAHLQSPAFLPVLLGALAERGIRVSFTPKQALVCCYEDETWNRLAENYEWDFHSDPIGLQALTACVLEAHEKGYL